MAAGDFHQRAPTSTDVLTTANLDAPWQDLNGQSATSTVSYVGPHFEVANAGPYLIYYSDAFSTADTTAGESIEIQSEILINGVAIQGGRNGSHISKLSGNGEAVINGHAIVELSALDTITIRHRRTDDSTVGTVARFVSGNVCCILELRDSDQYGRYATDASFATGATLARMPLGTIDREDAAFTIDVGTDELTVNETGKYVLTFSGEASIAGTAASEVYVQARLNGVLIPGAHSSAYMHGVDGCQNAGLGAMLIVECTAGDTIELVALDEGGAADIAAGFRLDMWQLPSGAQTCIAEATTGNFNAAWATFAWDTLKQNDAASFTHVAGSTSITPNQAGNYLAFFSLGKTSYQASAEVAPRTVMTLGGSYPFTSHASCYNKGSGNFGRATTNFVAVTTDGQVWGSTTSLAMKHLAAYSGGAIENQSGQFSVLMITDLFSGAVTSQGSADIASAWSATAAGTTPAATLQGTAAAATAWSATAAGTVAAAAIQGTSNAALALTATAAALRTTVGTTNTTSEFTASASASRTTTAATALVAALTSTTVALRRANADAAALTQLVVTTTATKRSPGVTAATTAFVVTSEASRNTSGVADGAIAIAASATATARRPATSVVASAFTFTAEADGVATGSASLVLQSTLSATASVRSQATAFAATALSATITATRSTAGQATAGQAFVATALATAKLQSTTTLNSALLATAEGVRGGDGSATITAALTATASATAVVQAAAAMVGATALTAAATTRRPGVVAISSAITSTASGLRSVPATTAATLASSLSASANIITRSTAAVSLATTSSAAPTARVGSTTSLSVELSATASAVKFGTSLGSASILTESTLVAAGRYRASAEIAFASALELASSALRMVQGTSSGNIAIGNTSAGTRHTPATAAISASLTTTALGSTGQLPGEADISTQFSLQALGTFASPVKYPILGTVSDGLAITGTIVSQLTIAGSVR